MNFDLPDEHQLLRSTVREFAIERVAPVAAELDREHRFPYELVQEMAELGLMGIPIPEEYGGAGSDTLSYAIAIEELTRIDSSVAITVAAHTSLGTMPIFLFGNDAQKQEWLPDLASGRKLAAFGLTEPEAGSDAGATRTRAEERNGSWVITGSKMFITNAGTDITACVTITARTGEDEISNLIVPNGTAGLRDLGADGEARLARVRHARALLPRLLRAGTATSSASVARGSSSSSRSSTAGASPSRPWGSVSRRGRTTSPTHTRSERKQFGRPISSFQAIQFQLADMAVEIEAGRQLVYRAAWLKDQDRPFAEAAAMAKLYTGELSTPRRQPGAADPRRLRVHGRVPDLAALPRPEDPGDRRGHERGAAHGHRKAPRLCSRPRSSARRADLSTRR